MSSIEAPRTVEWTYVLDTYDSIELPAVRDEGGKGDTVDVSVGTLAATIREHEDDVEADAIDALEASGDATGIITLTADPTDVTALERGRRYYVRVIWTLPDDHAMTDWQGEDDCVALVEMVTV